MNRKTLFFYACMAGAGMLILASCHKYPDYIDPRDADNVYDGCRIRQTINQSSPEQSVITRNFAYNSSNNPVSVTSAAVSTGNPNLLFKYDSKNRLTEFSGIYPNGQFEFVHKYGYIHNRIVTDTQYVFGTYATLSGYFSKRHKYLSYDGFGRIVQDSEVYVFPSPLTNVIHYSYDATGNLVNGKTYDAKLNPHRTNKIWMFVDRDYSVNNSVAAATYNISFLPLSYAPPGPSFDLIFGYLYYYGSTQIIYDCH
jgi:hypothetical protein